MNQQYNSITCITNCIEAPAGLCSRFHDDGKDRVFTQFTLDLRIMSGFTEVKVCIW
jgi:hypothetical protein